LFRWRQYTIINLFQSHLAVRVESRADELCQTITDCTNSQVLLTKQETTCHVTWKYDRHMPASQLMHTPVLRSSSSSHKLHSCHTQSLQYNTIQYNTNTLPIQNCNTYNVSQMAELEARSVTCGTWQSLQKSPAHWRRSLLGRAGSCPPTFCHQWASHVACPTTFWLQEVTILVDNHAENEHFQKCRLYLCVKWEQRPPR